MQGLAAQMLQVHQELQQRMCSPWDALFPRKPVGSSLSRLLQLWEYEASLTNQVLLCTVLHCFAVCSHMQHGSTFLQLWVLEATLSTQLLLCTY